MSEHPYQLRRVELHDFKSVADASVDLCPLTVVVGANSSGKSTLLQSILAFTQAVRSDVGGPEFPLNGEFVRLGTFDETRNFLAERPDTPMRIAFDLVDTRRHPPSRGRRVLGARTIESLRYRWSADLDRGQGTEGVGGFARLATLQIEVSALNEESPEPELRLTCDIASFGEPLTEDAHWASAARVAPFGQSRLSALALRSSPVEASGRVVDWTSGTSASIDAVALSGGLPAALLRRQSRFDQLADLWWDVAWDLFRDEIDAERDRARRGTSKVPMDAVTVAAQHIAGLVEGTDGEPGQRSWQSPPREAVLRDIGALDQTTRAEVVQSLARLDLADFKRALRGKLEGVNWITEETLVGPPGESGELLRDLGFASQRFFNSAVRYLGPLREAPHVLYDPGPSKLDLGVNGEYSAAVLHAQAKSYVVMPTPVGSGERRQLNEALDFWLREFELAESARSKDEGRMGIGLNVTPKGTGREVDLTSVGVGVSQVLPVILLCLLAQPGTLVILEQPELHLHPKLQTGLADFLLACTRAGRQLVVETHSEHLVNRLRYQIARDETDETHGLIRLVFAESERGTTSYREPAITPYGGLGDDWPTGFLDLTARESQELVRQSLAKRKRDEPSRDH